MKDKEEIKVLEFFLAGDRPTVLYRGWKERTGTVNLYAQQFDPETLEPLGDGQGVGVIKFSTFYGYGPDVKVTLSQDGEKILVYFDKIKSGAYQVVMCWVMNTKWEPEWNAAYRVPAHSINAFIDHFFADDGSVYLSVGATLLTDKVEERPDGSTRLSVSARDLRKRERAFFKLHGEEFLMWDGSLPGGVECEDLQLGVTGNKVYYAGLAYRSDRDDEVGGWVVGELSPRLEPGEPQWSARSKEKDGLIVVKKLVIAPDGSGYLIAMGRGRIHVCAMDESHQVRWQSSLNHRYGIQKLEPYLDDDGRLRLCLMSCTSQSGREADGVLVQRENCHSMFPVLVTFDEDGRPRSEDLLGRGQLGNRKMAGKVIWSEFKSVGQCGQFVDHTYNTRTPGVYRVPLK